MEQIKFDSKYNNILSKITLMLQEEKKIIQFVKNKKKITIMKIEKTSQNKTRNILQQNTQDVNDDENENQNESEQNKENDENESTTDEDYQEKTKPTLKRKIIKNENQSKKRKR